MTATVKASRRPAALMWGWLLLLLGVLFGIAPAGHLTGQYDGGVIDLREWMVVANTVILAWHALALAILVYGSAPDLSDPPGGRALRRAGQIGFGLTLLAVLLALAAPALLGTGPFAAESRDLALLTGLVHLPNVLRSLAWGLVVIPLADAAPTPGWRRATYLLLVPIGLDLATVLVHWAHTPVEVIAELHPCLTDLPWLAPWLVASVGFLTVLGRRRAMAPS